MTCVRITRGTDASSLASFVHTSVSMLHTAELHGLRGHVDWRSGWPAPYDSEAARRAHGDNMWDWYFEQPRATANEATNATLTWEWGTQPWPGTRQQHELPWCAGDLPGFACLRAVVPRFLRPNAVVRRQAGVLFSRHGLDPDRTIAVSHRGTDKSLEARVVPIEAYYPTLDTLLAGDPGARIWAQPEEAHVAAALTVRYGERCTVMPAFAVARRPDEMVDARPGDGYEKGLAAATLLTMFASCRVLLKNIANLSDLAAGLSKGRVFHFSSDAEPLEIRAPRAPLPLGDAKRLQHRGPAVPGPRAPGSEKLLIIRERDCGLFSMVQQVIDTVALLEHRRIDRIPVVILGAGSPYFHPAGHQGRRTVWEYYFEPVVPGWSEDSVLDVLGERAIEMLESKRRQLELQRHAFDSPPGTGATVPPMTEIDWRNVADLEALRGEGDWLFTESPQPVVDGHREPGPRLLTSRSDLVRRCVRPRDSIRRKADAFFDHRLRGHHVIGVHVGGTDGKVPFAPLFDKIEARLAAVVGRTASRVFLAADQADTIARFSRRFGDRLVCYEPVRRAHREEGAAADPAEGRAPGDVTKICDRQSGEDAPVDAGEHAVVTCLILSKCDLLIHDGSPLPETAAGLGAETITVERL